jgi:hypothetical protein
MLSFIEQYHLEGEMGEIEAIRPRSFGTAVCCDSHTWRAGLCKLAIDNKQQGKHPCIAAKPYFAA